MTKRRKPNPPTPPARAAGAPSPTTGPAKNPGTSPATSPGTGLTTGPGTSPASPAQIPSDLSGLSGPSDLSGLSGLSDLPDLPHGLPDPEDTPTVRLSPDAAGQLAEGGHAALPGQNPSALPGWQSLGPGVKARHAAPRQGPRERKVRW